MTAERQPKAESERGVPEYSADQMMQRWFRNVKPIKSNRGTYAWVAVSEVFGVGSTVAMDQCERYGVSPHQRVRRFWS